MKIISTKSSLKNIKTDAVAVIINEDRTLFIHQKNELLNILKTPIKRIIELEKFRGKAGSVAFSYTDNTIKSPRIILIGIGKSKMVTLEFYRKAAALAAKTAQSLKVKRLALQFPHTYKYSIADISQSLCEGFLLSQYKFDKYITVKNHDKVKLTEFNIFTNDDAQFKLISEGVKAAKIICDGVILARELANAPASEIYPETLAQIAKKSAEKFNYKAEIWNEHKIKQEGFGGLLAVSQGSSKPPRFIILKFNNSKNNPKPIVLIGKGITFDSGGISLKPSLNMSEMKMDMAGAAAILAIIQTAARLKLPVNVIGLIPATENMPSGSALKPGDIIKHYGGKTSEVENTDAEGRLILADSLAYAHNYQPEVVIDLATLTGAIIAALGHYASGIMGNDQDLINKIQAAGEKTNERVWQLPLYDEYSEQIKSEVADVKNMGTRGAGAITAAMFLKHFIKSKNKKEYKWAHLDIAGTAILDQNSDYIQKGASGVGVRLLIEFLKNF